MKLQLCLLVLLKCLYTTSGKTSDLSEEIKSVTVFILDIHCMAVSVYHISISTFLLNYCSEYADCTN